MVSSEPGDRVVRKARVLIADGNPLLLEGIRELLQLRSEVAGTAGDGNSLLEYAHAASPQVVVLDVSSPGINGIDATQEITALCPSTKTVILSMHDGPIYIRRSFNAGAAGYVFKARASED